MKTISKIIEFVFGKRYYLCIVNKTGTKEYYVNDTMFTSKAQVEEYKRVLLGVRSYQYIETVSFRCRTDYYNVEVGNGIQ